MHRLLFAASALWLTGCVAAAPLLLSGAGLAFTGYGVYSIGHISDAKYDFDKSTPNPAQVSEIRAANTVAVFPTNSAIDGTVVDIFNERSGLTTVSSKKTIGVIEKSKLTQAKILSYPAADRAGELQSFGRAAGADLVVFATHTDTNLKTNALMMGKSKAVIEVNCQIVSAKTGAILGDENHRVTFDPRGMPTDQEIAQLVAMGVADRLYELKTGSRRKAEKSS